MVARARELFVGRAAELATLAEACAQASSGRAGIVSVEGPAGIGKTALVRAFLTAASPMAVISASGDEAEAAVSWGVLSQLGRGGAAARCALLRRMGELTADADPLATGRLLYDTLAVLSSEGLAVVVVEDLQWIDRPSAVALRFALRRLTMERVLAVVTTRLEGSVFDAEWRRLFDDGGTRLRLTGLAVAEAAQLLSALRATAVSWPTARRLWRHTGGNPLYIRCLAEELDPEMLTGATGLLPAPRSLAAWLAARMAACSPGTQDLVSAAAVLGDQCPLALAASLADAPSPADALGEAQAAGLLAENYREGVRQVEFPDAVARAAIYFNLSLSRRAVLHRSAAQLCIGTAALSHRMAAAIGPDAALATELTELARVESAAGLHGSAAGHLMDAADLSREPALREDRLLAACTSWLRSGAVHEVSSRRGMLEALPPSPARDHLRASLAQLEGRRDEARTAWQAALHQLQAAGGHDALRAEVAAHLAGLALFDWNWQTALVLAPAVPRAGSGVPLLVRCVALTMAGRAAEARKVLAGGRQGGTPARCFIPESLARGFIGAWSDDLQDAKRNLQEITDRPADFGGGLRATAQWLLADVSYRLGEFDDALTAAGLAQAILQDTGRAQSTDAAAAHAVAAYVASARGDWTEARNLISAAGTRATTTAPKLALACAAAARWSLAVALDEPQEMLRAAYALEESASAPELSIFPVGPVMAEALWRNRRLEEAAAQLAAYECQARQLGRLSALVGACRLRGLLEASRHDGRAALRALDEAAPVAEQLAQPLEIARFLAAHGLVLAWLGRRAAAADKVGRARIMLERIGARPYLQRVDEQLQRLGYGSRHRPHTGELTASELVVARLVASGLSNKQAAEQLLVSVKAVEFHLTNVYTKLGVSSRSQLAARRDSLVTAAARQKT